MASTRKIVLASYIFDQIEQKKLDLNQELDISSKDITLGSGTLKTIIKQGEIHTYAINDLLGFMLRESDNTAADRLMAIAGGHEVIDGWLKKHNMDNIRFATDINTWLKEQAYKTIRYHEAQQRIFQSTAPFYIKAVAWLASWIPEPETIDFSDETTNVATPEALNNFIYNCYQRKAPGLHSNENRNLLLQWMKQCKTGTNRMPKYIKNATVYHKTGSGIVGICNDAGIIEQKNKAPVVLTIFIKDSVEPLPKLEETIAQVTQHIYNVLSSDTS